MSTRPKTEPALLEPRSGITLLRFGAQQEFDLLFVVYFRAVFIDNADRLPPKAPLVGIVRLRYCFLLSKGLSALSRSLLKRADAFNDATHVVTLHKVHLRHAITALTAW
jgi:hypothetical protein